MDKEMTETRKRSTVGEVYALGGGDGQGDD